MACACAFAGDGVSVSDEHLRESVRQALADPRLETAADGICTGRVRAVMRKLASIPATVTVVTVGDEMAFVGLSDEPTAELAESVRAKSPYRQTVLAKGPARGPDGEASASADNLLAAKMAARKLESVILGELAKGDVVFESKRKMLLDRPRDVIWNTDGCDMLYYPNGLPIDESAFCSLRLAKTRGTTVDSLSYCPVSSGFGAFTAAKAGEFMTNSLASPKKSNAALRFRDRLGTDALEMAGRFARREGLEFTVSLRMNDTHDASPRSAALFPEWKRTHPDCLFGTREGPRSKGYCRWSAVDYGRAEVRDRLKEIVRQFVENYDVDGVEYDFNRHSQFFHSVFDGGVANDSERATMTQLMRELRAITEEAGRCRGRPVLVSARTNDSAERTQAEGLDVDAWMREKLIDIWIPTGYFQQRPWSDSVARARAAGCRIYAAMDESRTEETAAKRKLDCLSGRSRYLPDGGCRAFYAARISAAIASGVDGVWLFNLEGYSGLPAVGSIFPRDTEGLPKRYFATERDPANADYTMKDGVRFDTMPNVFPLKPRVLASGASYAFSIFVGDDFSVARRRGLRPVTKVEVLTGGAPVAVSLNGSPLTLTPTGRSGLFEALVSEELLRKGVNAFAVTASEPTTLNDFLLTIDYRKDD